MFKHLSFALTSLTFTVISATGSLSPLFAESPAAIVVFATGERTLIQNGHNLDLETDDLMYAGEEIETGDDGKVSLQSSRGVIFHINPGTRIQIRDLTSTTTGDSIFVI